MTDKSQQREFEIAEIDSFFDHASECFHNGIPLEPTKQALLLDMAIYLRSSLSDQPAVAGAVDDDKLAVVAYKLRQLFGRPDADGKFWKWDDLPESNRLNWLSHARDVAALVRTASPSQPAAEMGEKLSSLAVECTLKDMQDTADDPMWADHCEVPRATLKRWVRVLRRASPADDGNLASDMEECLLIFQRAFQDDGSNTFDDPSEIATLRHRSRAALRKWADRSFRQQDKQS